jgi:hypothetical protein
VRDRERQTKSDRQTDRQGVRVSVFDRYTIFFGWKPSQFFVVEEVLAFFADHFNCLFI